MAVPKLTVALVWRWPVLVSDVSYAPQFIRLGLRVRKTKITSV